MKIYKLSKIPTYIDIGHKNTEFILWQYKNGIIEKSPVLKGFNSHESFFGYNEKFEGRYDLKTKILSIASEDGNVPNPILNSIKNAFPQYSKIYTFGGLLADENTNRIANSVIANSDKIYKLSKKIKDYLDTGHDPSDQYILWRIINGTFEKSPILTNQSKTHTDYFGHMYGTKFSGRYDVNTKIISIGTLDGQIPNSIISLIKSYFPKYEHIYVFGQYDKLVTRIATKSLKSPKSPKSLKTPTNYLDIGHNNDPYQLWIFVNGEIKISPILDSKKNRRSHFRYFEGNEDFSLSGRYEINSGRLSIGANKPISNSILSRILSAFPNYKEVYEFNTFGQPVRRIANNII